jgi:hypothetical protein
VAVEELDWDSPDSQHSLEQLAATHPDYIIAADCLYIDEASKSLFQALLSSAWQSLHPGHTF